mgnify:FL=1
MKSDNKNITKEPKNNMIIKFKKMDDRAVIPSKAHSTDIGYDVTFISVEKVVVGRFLFFKKYKYIYDSGIAVKPPEGYYVDMIPRSGFSKTGFVCANSFGFIDPEYRGSCKAVLYKVNPFAKDLVLPGRYFQFVLRPIIEADPIEVEELDETERGSGGFGSTGI